ncbi:MAG: helix-turn-helix domain-containing protein [Pyrinomonadaceae bacterium]|nr:helix-turn-helix domain-containing protein [Pyrinomonadaceae bacterium]
MPVKEMTQLPDPLPKFLTVAEVALLLRLSKRTVYDLVSQRRIPFRKAGDRTIFDRDEILEWTKREEAA